MLKARPAVSDWGMIDTTYNIFCDHTHLDRVTVSEADAHRMMCQRMSFLSRKLIEDLEDGEKLFVYRYCRPAAGGRRGRAAGGGGQPLWPQRSLLFVCRADERHPPFTVRRLHAGLMVGTHGLVRARPGRHAVEHRWLGASCAATPTPNGPPAPEARPLRSTARLPNPEGCAPPHPRRTPWPHPVFPGYPSRPASQHRVRALEAAEAVGWAELVALASQKLDFLKTERLDRLLLRHFGDAPPPGTADPTGAAWRCWDRPPPCTCRPRSGWRGCDATLPVTVHEGEYGQYAQELDDPDSALHRFRPDLVLLAFDARHVAAGLDPAADAAGSERALQECLGRMQRCWKAAQAIGATVIQQTVLPTLPSLMGSNEQRLPGSAAALVARLNQALPAAADAAGVHLLSLAGVSRPRMASRRGTTRCCGTAPSRTSPRWRRRSMATWWAGCWQRCRGARPSAWCWTWTTPCGAG